MAIAKFTVWTVLFVFFIGWPLGLFEIITGGKVAAFKSEEGPWLVLIIKSIWEYMMGRAGDSKNDKGEVLAWWRRALILPFYTAFIIVGSLILAPIRAILDTWRAVRDRPGQALYGLPPAGPRPEDKKTDSTPLDDVADS